MTSFKTLFVPDQEGSGIKENIRNNTTDIILKLASINGYNEDREIRGSNGSFMPGTDVATLISYTLQPDKMVSGKSDFVRLLLQAGVPTNMIANEHMRVFIPSQQVTHVAPTTTEKIGPLMHQLDPDKIFESLEPYIDQTYPQSRAQSIPPLTLQSNITPLPTPPLLGPFPSGPRVDPPRKRGRPVKNQPPPPELQGPYHPPTREAHEIPLPDSDEEQDPVYIGKRKATHDVNPQYLKKKYRTIADLSDDDDN